MNKTEALAKLAALEAETAALRKIIEAPEALPSLLVKPDEGVAYWQVHSGLYGTTGITKNAINDDYEYGGNTFQSEPLARAYADAIETMLLLRHQPGTEAAQYGGMQFVVRVSKDGLLADGFQIRTNKMSEISPCFSTKEAAEQAIQTVGSERILRMFNTFHHAED